jgi:hypothetical protein
MLKKKKKKRRDFCSILANLKRAYGLGKREKCRRLKQNAVV